MRKAGINSLALDKFQADRIAQLQSQEAAPLLSELSKFSRDPNYQTPEALQVLTQENPLPTTQKINGNWQERPGMDNPEFAKGLEAFQQGSQNILDRFKASQGDPMAVARLDKVNAGIFDNTTQGGKRIFDQRQTTRTNAAEDKLNLLISKYPLTGSIESWNGMAEAAYAIPGIDPKTVDARLKEIAGRNEGPVGEPLKQFVTNGPNSTRSQVRLDLFGKPVANTSISSTNNPSDRELGLAPEKGTADPTPGVQMFWTQSNPNAPPMIEQVVVGSPRYNRLMTGDYQATGRVKPFGKKGQMTSGQAQGSFKYSPQDRVTTVNDAGAVVSTTTAKTVKGGESAPAAIDPSTAQKLVKKYGSAEAARAAYAKGER
jgi:hypothetical protein